MKTCEDVKVFDIFILIYLSLFIKLGLFPFHLWIIFISESISWEIFIFLLTIQKILPLITLRILINSINLNFLLIFNMIFSTISGIKIISIRKIIVFSSLNNLSILIFLSKIRKKKIEVYFFFYSIITFIFIKEIKEYNNNFIFQTFWIKKNKWNSLIISFNLFRIIGLPPFLGFIPKVFVLIELIKEDIIIIRFFLIWLRCLATVFYLRIIFSNIFLSINNFKIKKKIYFSSNQLFLILFSISNIIYLWNFKLKKLLIFKIKIIIN